MDMITGDHLSLTISADHIDQLRDHLIQDDDLERMAVAFCSESGDSSLLIEDIRLIEDNEHEVQTPSACRLDLDLEYELVKEARNRGMHPLFIHSHWFDPEPSFSPTDNELMPRLHRFVKGMYPESTVSFAVLGTRGLDTAIYDPEADQFETVPVDIIGDWTLDPSMTTPSRMPIEQTEIDRERTDRSVRAFTEEGQRRLATAHIGLIGAGGLGSIAAIELARCGIGEITVIDPDVVEKSNLNRLFGAYEYHIGRPKVDAVEELLYKANPHIEVTAIQESAQNAGEALKQCDLLVAGVDRMTARTWLNEFAVRHLIPYIDAGVVISTKEQENIESHESADRRIESLEGYIQFIVPGVTACFSCLDRHDPEVARIEQLDDDELQDEVERGYIEKTALSPEPAVAPLNGVIASKTVMMVSKWATGYATPEAWIRFEDIENELNSFPTTPSAACPACGTDGVLGRGDRQVTADEIETTGLDLDADFARFDGVTPGEEMRPEHDRQTVPNQVGVYFAHLHPASN